MNDGLPLHKHILIVGQSGSGKSNVLMSTMIKRINDNQEIYVIDVKREIAPLFGKYVKCVYIDEATELFTTLINKSKERQELFSKTSEKLEKPIRDYSDYRKYTGNTLPIITLYIEELVYLMGRIEEQELIDLLVIGRSAGIFVVCLSQYLTAKILSRAASVNFNVTMYLGVWDKIAAGILFGNLDKDITSKYKEWMGPPGRAVIREDNKMFMHFVPRITDEMLIPYIKKEI